MLNNQLIRKYRNNCGRYISCSGYMPPEYIDRRAITSKFDVFSLGVIILQIVTGYDGYYKCEHMPPQEFIEHVHENWGKRMQETMSSHTSEQVITCIKIALRCVEFDREKRPTIAGIIDELNKIDNAESSATDKNTEENEHTLEKLPEIQEQKKESTEDDSRYARTNRISTLVENQAELVDFPAGPMGSLLPKLLEFLSDEYNYLHADCKKDVEYVYNELVGMQAALHKVAEVPQDQQLDSVVKLWTEEVNDLSYQVDNTVDSFLARFWASEFGMSPNLRSQKQQLPRKTSGAKKKGNGQKKRAR
uniref:Protein kinase domain-containing protein n=1 Tax=Aegilops tauschii subsp. strangulata TaxID=200361 RepID=A0A453A0Q4_AEGTS